MTKDGGGVRGRVGEGFVYTSSKMLLENSTVLQIVLSPCELGGLLHANAHQEKRPKPSMWLDVARKEGADWTRAPANRSPQVPAP